MGTVRPRLPPPPPSRLPRSIALRQRPTPLAAAVPRPWGGQRGRVPPATPPWGYSLPLRARAAWAPAGAMLCTCYGVTTDPEFWGGVPRAWSRWDTEPRGAAWGGTPPPPEPSMASPRSQPVPGLRLLPKCPLGCVSRVHRACELRVERASRMLRVLRAGPVSGVASVVPAACTEPRAPPSPAACELRASGRVRACVVCAERCVHMRPRCSAWPRRACERAAARRLSAAPASPSLR